MKITGELLKAERLKQGMAVADVASSLKLSSRIINSIEAGDLSELPAKTFIRGFVKSYAQHLKLDADSILRQFLEEMGSTQPLPKVPPPQAAPANGRLKKSRPVMDEGSATTLDLNRDSRKKTILYISVACALLFIILAINNLVEKYQKAAYVDKIEVAQVQPLQTSENVLAPIEVSSQTLPAAAAPTDNSAKVSSTATAPAVTPNPSAEKPAVADLSVVTSAPPDFEPSLGRPVELIVVAKKETEFFYAKGNTKNFVRVKLAPKEVQIIRSTAGLHLKTEDGSAINLILNGIEKGQASSPNKPLRLTF